MMDSLKEQIALNGSEYGVREWCGHLSERQQARIRSQYYDLLIAALHSFEAVSNARAIRAQAFASEN